MELTNPISVHRGDARYEPINPEVQQDLLDNNTDYIVVGDKTVVRKVVLDYSFELPIAGRAITGRFTFNHDGSNVDLENAYNFIKPLIDGVAFSGAIVGNEIRLVIVTNSIGENPTIRYRKTSIKVAA